MKEYLNCGVYEVDLKGETDASFKGAQPFIIIQKLTEPTFYFIIPLTTYTKEKWEKLRKYGCCTLLFSTVFSFIKFDLAPEWLTKKEIGTPSGCLSLFYLPNIFKTLLFLKQLFTL